MVRSNEIDMSDSRYSMTDDGLMIKSTSSKDVGTYECMVKKENVELKSRPAKIILEPDVAGCKYINCGNSPSLVRAYGAHTK